MSLGELMHGGRVKSPEENLVFAILSRAVQDLFGVRDGSARSGTTDAVMEDSLTFFTAEHGPWAARRKELCEAVSIDHEALRRRIVAILESEAETTRGEHRDVSHTGRARALWAARKAAPAPETSRQRRYTADDVLRLLPDQPTSIQNLAQMLKTGFKQLRTPLSKLEGRGLVERTGKDVYRKVPQSRKLAAPPPSPAPLIPMRLHPVSKRAISNYANVRQIVHGLLIEPHAFRDLIFATNGDVSEGTIRSVLNNGLLKGELSRADDGRYQLVTSALPQLSVAANSG